MTNSPLKITSTSNATIKELCKLKNKPSAQRFLIEGKHLVDEAFAHGCLTEVYSLEEVDYPGVKVTLVSREVLEKLAFSKTPSGLVGVAKKAEVTPKNGKILLLESVQDPGNVGTLLRSAVAFGYDHVASSKDTASFYSPKVIASSQGAIFSLCLQSVEDVPSYIEKKKGEGYLVYAGALRNAVPLREIPPYEGPKMVVVGNEGQGITNKTLDVSSRIVKIEMEGIESLNVGVAGAILMYQL